MYRITLAPSWRITDTLCGIPFVDGVALVDELDDRALGRLSEMGPIVEALDPAVTPPAPGDQQEAADPTPPPESDEHRDVPPVVSTDA